jgi:hypothetical protein
MTVAISPLRALLNVETSTPLPRLSSAMMLDAPENREIRDIWLLPPDNPNLHAGRKVAVVATDGVEEIELTTVIHHFRSCGAHVDLIAPKKPNYPNYLGLQVPAVRETHILTINFVAPQAAGMSCYSEAYETTPARADFLVELRGFEPLTSSGRCQGNGGSSTPRAHALFQMTIYAARARHSANAAERLCL